MHSGIQQSEQTVYIRGEISIPASARRYPHRGQQCGDTRVTYPGHTLDNVCLLVTDKRRE